MARGTCFLAHCPGFKLVLSAHEADGSMSLLVSREPTEAGSEKMPQLSSMLTLLMQAQPSRPSDTSPWRKGFAFGKTTPPRPVVRQPIIRAPARPMLGGRQARHGFADVLAPAAVRA